MDKAVGKSAWWERCILLRARLSGCISIPRTTPLGPIQMQCSLRAGNSKAHMNFATKEINRNGLAYDELVCNLKVWTWLTIASPVVAHVHRITLTMAQLESLYLSATIMANLCVYASTSETHPNVFVQPAEPAPIKLAADWVSKAMASETWRTIRIFKGVF